MSESKASTLIQTFARLADTLVADFDVVDLLQMLVETCTENLDISEAGLLLADQHGQLELVASTSESSRIVELIQLAADAGPCIVSYRLGRVVSVENVGDSPEWPSFRESALTQGFNSVHAVPLRLRDATIGTLNLLRHDVGVLGDEDLVVAQALADVATIGILQNRALRDSTALAGQLQNALNSRVVIEQAKGVLSFLHNVEVEEAFRMLREYSRSHNERLGDVASRVVDRSLNI